MDKPDKNEKDVVEEEKEEKLLSPLFDAHKKFILALDDHKDTFEYHVMEHLRMSGVYWGCTAMYLLGALDGMKGDDIVEWIKKCGHEDGGYGGNLDHDSHLLYTLSAIQILALFDRLDVLDVEKTTNYIKNLQNEDGSFKGDEWGEVDTRFSYCALSALSLIGRMDAINVERAVEYVHKCKNFDEGFGAIPGAESHAGQIFTCVGALSIVKRLDLIDRDMLSWWLCERQCANGGLNGRPEKLADVCYSWWVVSSLEMLERLDWIDKDGLRKFILQAQDDDTGGIADRPGDVPDVFHTFFGLAGLSLLGNRDLRRIDPIYALPVDTLKRMGIHTPSTEKYD